MMDFPSSSISVSSSGASRPASSFRATRGTRIVIELSQSRSPRMRSLMECLPKEEGGAAVAAREMRIAEPVPEIPSLRTLVAGVMFEEIETSVGFLLASMSEGRMPTFTDEHVFSLGVSFAYISRVFKSRLTRLILEEVCFSQFLSLSSSQRSRLLKEALKRDFVVSEEELVSESSSDAPILYSGLPVSESSINKQQINCLEAIRQVALLGSFFMLTKIKPDLSSEELSSHHSYLNNSKYVTVRLEKLKFPKTWEAFSLIYSYITNINNTLLKEGLAALEDYYRFYTSSSSTSVEYPLQKKSDLYRALIRAISYNNNYYVENRILSAKFFIKEVDKLMQVVNNLGYLKPLIQQISNRGILNIARYIYKESSAQQVSHLQVCFDVLEARVELYKARVSTFQTCVNAILKQDATHLKDAINVWKALKNAYAAVVQIHSYCDMIDFKAEWPTKVGKNSLIGNITKKFKTIAKQLGNPKESIISLFGQYEEAYRATLDLNDFASNISDLSLMEDFGKEIGFDVSFITNALGELGKET